MFCIGSLWCLGQEFDRQCLIADNDPFTGAMNMAHAEVCHIQGTDETHLTYLDFRKAELMVEPVERKYCKWFLHETFLNHIANIQDDNHTPIWRKPDDGIILKKFENKNLAEECIKQPCFCFDYLNANHEDKDRIIEYTKFNLVFDIKLQEKGKLKAIFTCRYLEAIQIMLNEEEISNIYKITEVNKNKITIQITVGL